MATKKLPKKAKASSSSEAYALAVEKMASSGLTEHDMEILGIEVLEPPQTLGLNARFKELPALRLNYYDPMDPERMLSGWPGWPPFYRIRYLKQGTDFASLAEKKPIRYTNEANAGVCAYFPRNIDWVPILMDPDIPLIFTEGEFKAAAACKADYPTIGLGGVYNYKSTKLGISFLNELEQIIWVKRNVYIIFDSDFKTNEMVCGALNDLAEELMKRGAIPHLVSLPDVVENGKTGLDDFLLVSKPDELGQLLHDRAQPLTLSKAMWQLNNEVVYIMNPGLVLVQETGQKLAPGPFKEHAFATLDHSELVVNKDGTTSMRPTSAAAAWLKWQLRGEAGKLTYAPGMPKMIQHKSKSPKLSQWNIWPGWGVEPAEGDVQPFLDLVDHIFTGATPQIKTWFLRWLAYPLQYPGTKMFTSVLVHGVKHGTGKSLIGYTLGRIYGQNFTEIGGDDLHGNFNEWAEGKQFVMGDDVTGSDKREDGDKLKKFITQQQLRINMKFLPSYVVPDCINYYFNSNHPDAFFLEDDDRRNFVWEVMVGRMSEEFYMEYELWLDSGGAQAVFDYMLKLDLGDFNPAAPAMKTDAKSRMIAGTKSDLGSWVSRLINDPDSMLKVGEMSIDGDLFTNRHLLELYDPTQRTRTTANGLGRELSRAGVPQAANGNPIKTKEGQDRYYILRNHKKWLEMSVADVQSYLSKTAFKTVPKESKAKY